MRMTDEQFNSRIDLGEVPLDHFFWRVEPDEVAGPHIVTLYGWLKDGARSDEAFLPVKLRGGEAIQFALDLIQQAAPDWDVTELKKLAIAMGS